MKSSTIVAFALLACGLSSAGSTAADERTGQGAKDGPAGAVEGAPVPASFYGVVDQRAGIPRSEIKRLRRGRVGTVRLLIPWGEIEPSRGEYRWAELDRRIRALRRTRAVVLPLVYGTPRWLTPAALPSGEEAALRGWSQFLRALVARYGSGGTLDRAERRHRPIRSWQVWNEPNLTAFWGGLEPSPRGYVRLLRRSAEAIGAVDPAAAIVLAGLSPANRGIDPTEFLDRIYGEYSRLGLEPDFDQLALHPYARRLIDVREQVRRSIAVARAATGETPSTIIAEVGWGSDDRGFHPLTGSERDQARRLRGVYRMFERRRIAWGIESVLWYSWRDLPRQAPACSFCTMTGLLDSRGEPKQAWKAFKRVREKRGR